MAFRFPLTGEEIAERKSRIKGFIEQGMNSYQIAEAMGMKRPTILSFCHTHGIRIPQQKRTQRSPIIEETHRIERSEEDGEDNED